MEAAKRVELNLLRDEVRARELSFIQQQNARTAELQEEHKEALKKLQRETREEVVKLNKEHEQLQLELAAAQERKELARLELQVREVEFCESAEKLQTRFKSLDERREKACAEAEQLRLERHTVDCDLAKALEDRAQAVAKYESREVAFRGLEAELRGYQSVLLRNLALQSLQRFPGLQAECRLMKSTRRMPRGILDQGGNVGAANEGTNNPTEKAVREEEGLEHGRPGAVERVSLSSLAQQEFCIDLLADATDVVLVGRPVPRSTLLGAAIRSYAPDQYDHFMYNASLVRGSGYVVLERKHVMCGSGTSVWTRTEYVCLGRGGWDMSTSWDPSSWDPSS